MAPETPRAEIRNAISVDVEEYFQVAAFSGTVARGDWERLPGRVARNTERVLDLFAAHGVSGTFFVLGWVAGRYPSLVRRIVAEGHELASHGMEHAPVTTMDRASFGRDVRDSKALLEDTAGRLVRGYRAPSYSIDSRNLWALEELAEAGYAYSSSIYPIRHDLYGMPEAPRFAFRGAGNPGVLEVPITTVRMGGCNWPCGGGGYFRLLPYAWFRWALRRVNRHENSPAVFYFHPWELDPDQPRVTGAPWRSRCRHYLNLHRTQARLTRLLSDFRWDRMDRVYLDEIGACR